MSREQWWRWLPLLEPPSRLPDSVGGGASLACLQAAGGKAKSECAAGFCLGEAFLLQASLLSSESVITGQGVGGLPSIHYKS